MAAGIPLSQEEIHAMTAPLEVAPLPVQAEEVPPQSLVPLQQSTLPQEHSPLPQEAAAAGMPSLPVADVAPDAIADRAIALPAMTEKGTSKKKKSMKSSKKKK